MFEYLILNIVDNEKKLPGIVWNKLEEFLQELTKYK